MGVEWELRGFNGSYGDLMGVNGSYWDLMGVEWDLM